MSDFATKVSIILDGAAPLAQIEACIKSLQSSGASEILVAGDALTLYPLASAPERQPDSAAFTHSPLPFALPIEPPALPVGRRWNEAAKAAKEDFLLFIRPWVRLEPSGVAALAEVLARDLSIGACAPALFTSDGASASQELILIEDQCKRRPIDLILRPVKFTYAPDWPSVPQDGIAYLPDALMVRKVAFWAAGGWGENLENEVLGLSLGLGLKELNWRVVCERASKAITACPASDTLEFDVRDRQDLVFRRYGRFLPHAIRTTDGIIRDHPWIPSNTGDIPTLCQGVPSPFSPLISGNSYRSGDIPGERCSVVVVTYNSMTSIQACITSLKENLGYFDELILVDNGSRDGTPDFLKSLEGADPRIKVVLNRKNLGFSAGCNMGIEESSGEYIVLLNPDTVVTEGWLARMRAYFQDPTVGAVGPISNGAFGLQGYNCHFPRNVKSNLTPAEVHALTTQVNARRSIESKLLIGFCQMVPRAVLDKVGHLDPELFLGCDDLDLSWRLRLAGYRLLIASDVFVLHKVHVSFRTEPLEVTQALEKRSADAFARKLKKYYGTGQVPSQEELWGINWFRSDVEIWPKAA